MLYKPFYKSIAKRIFDKQAHSLRDPLTIGVGEEVCFGGQHPPPNSPGRNYNRNIETTEKIN